MKIKYSKDALIEYIEGVKYYNLQRAGLGYEFANKIRSAIKHIAKKNTKQLSDFKNKYPDCNKSESKHSDKYNKLIIEAMGGMGDNDLEKENKIIKKVAKEVILDKE